MENIRLDVNNPILLMMGIETNNLWNNEFQKELFLKTLYQTAYKNNFSWEHSAIMTRKLGISMKDYVELLKEYMKKLPDVARPIVREIDGQYIITRRPKTTLERLYDKLCELKRLDEIVKFFDRFCMYKTMILTKYKNFKEIYSYDEYRQIEANIKAYTNEEERKRQELLKRQAMEKEKTEQDRDRLYRAKTHYFVQDRFKEEEKPVVVKEDTKKVYDEAIRAIKLVVESKSNHILNILDENNIDREDFFRKYLKIIQDSEDKSLYNKYKKKILSIKKQLLEEIKIPIEENGRKREFDIIDYLLITDMSPKRLSDSVSSHSEVRTTTRSEYKALDKKFGDCIFNSKEIQEKVEQKAISDMFSCPEIVGAKDEKGRVIEGTSRPLTKEEIQSFINFLKCNHIQINSKTLKAMKNRFEKGFTSQSKKLIIQPLNRAI